MLNPLEALRPFFETAALNPRGICLLWRPELIWTHAVSDVLIGVAYFSIPLALGVFLYHRRDVRFGWAVWLFLLFIMLCGVTHFMMVWTLWNADHGIEALIKAATAAASIVTAIALWPLLPKAIALPSTAALQARIAERDAGLAEARIAMASMVQMEEHQRQQARLLEEVNRSEARLRSVFENAAVGIARVGLDGTFLEVNDCFCKIAGWPRDELVAGGFQRITHPEDLEADLARVEDLLAGRAGSYSMEKRYVRADGGVVWIELTVSLGRGRDGEPDHFVAIIQDITEKRRTQETRDLLMREVDHRARNALAVVQSVVRLTDAVDPEQFKAVVTGRVDALARAQASLSSGYWGGARVADIVGQELSSTAPAAQWNAEGPELELPPEQVQPLSMILHELATNALKYGALSVQEGRVAVRWDEERGAGWRLTWQEAGGPVVRPPERTGFGSRLITRLARELDGQIEFAWLEAGLRADLISQPRRAAPADHPFIGAMARLRRDLDEQDGV